MASESIYQHDYFLFQTGHPGSESVESSAVKALLAQKAKAVYQQMAGLQEKREHQDDRVKNDAQEQILEAILQDDEPETFNIETPEQAKALLVLAHFDKSLNRMVIEQQALSKTDVRSAYRRILKYYHPDQTHVAITGEIIQKVQAAYALLRPQL